MTYKLDSISDEEAARQEKPPEHEVWIDCPMGLVESKFCGTATVSYPYGPIGPETVKFNLTAYIKHLIEQGK